MIADSYLRTATSFLNALNCSGVGSVTFKIFTATSPTTKCTTLSYPWPTKSTVSSRETLLQAHWTDLSTVTCHVVEKWKVQFESVKVDAVTPESALPYLKCIPTMPFPFVYSSKWAWTDAGVQIHLAGLDFPVVTRVPLVPRPLDEQKSKRCNCCETSLWNITTYHNQ